MHKALLSFFFPPSQAEQQVAQYTPEMFCKHIPDTPIELEKDTFALALYHDTMIRSTVWALKYYRSRHAAMLFAHALYQKLNTLLIAPTLLIPIPRSPERVRKYGYSQMELLTQEYANLDENKTCTIHTNILRNTLHTKNQTSIKSREARIKNAQGRFVVTNIELPHNHTIVLLDDVTTTGATLREARHVLLEAGVQRVICIACAY